MSAFGHNPAVRKSTRPGGEENSYPYRLAKQETSCRCVAFVFPGCLEAHRFISLGVGKSSEKEKQRKINTFTFFFSPVTFSGNVKKISILIFAATKIKGVI